MAFPPKVKKADIIKLHIGDRLLVLIQVPILKGSKLQISLPPTPLLPEHLNLKQVRYSGVATNIPKMPVSLSQQWNLESAVPKSHLKKNLAARKKKSTIFGGRSLLAPVVPKFIRENT